MIVSLSPICFHPIEKSREVCVHPLEYCRVVFITRPKWTDRFSLFEYLKQKLEVSPIRIQSDLSFWNNRKNNSKPQEFPSWDDLQKRDGTQFQSFLIALLQIFLSLMAFLFDGVTLMKLLQIYGLWRSRFINTKNVRISKYCTVCFIAGRWRRYCWGQQQDRRFDIWSR